MKNKIVLFISIFFISLFLFSKVTAVSGPALVINDSLKRCGSYAPSNNTELKIGWHYASSYINWENWSDYCNSIGYTFSWDYDTENPNGYSYLTYLALFASIIISYLSIKILLKKKKITNKV